MAKFITFIALTILSVAMLFAGFVFIGVPDNGGWNHYPLSGAFIGVGVIGILTFGILAGGASEDLPIRWRL